MPAFKRGIVTRVLEEHEGLTRLVVEVDADEYRAALFTRLTGPADVGDEVVLNTLGVDLGLGTGGEAFVLWNSSNPRPPGPEEGHIVKLRYTPLQVEVVAAGAPESPDRDLLAAETSIGEMPVVVCGLHSQFPAVAAGIRAAAPAARIAYVMSDGAGLTLAWSDLVRAARSAGLIDLTCTYGHAFGGDLEAVNVYSALAAVRHSARADVAVIAMGPGVVGTGSALGFTALEQGPALDAAAALGGVPIACLRICFADERERHHGLSHHSVTALTIATRSRVRVAVPQELAGDPLLQEGLGLLAVRHELVTASGRGGLELMERVGLRPRSMGRELAEIPELFLAAAAAGEVAAGLL